MTRLETIFRSLLFVILIFVGWTVWAQPAAPVIQIVEPANESVFTNGTTITITAETSLPESSIRSVEFFRDKTTSLGTVTNEPYQITWANVPKGVFYLRAKVNPISGASETSPSVKIRVELKDVFLTFGLNRVSLLNQYEVFGFPLWQYIASLIYIFLAYYLSKLLDVLTRLWLKRWAARTESKLDDLFLDLLHGPVRVIAFVIFLHFGLQDFPWNRSMQNFLDKSYNFIVACTITYLILKTIDMLMGYWRERSIGMDDRSFDEHLFPIIRKSLKIFVLVVSAVFIIGNVFEQDIKALIASLSIGGLALGLAAQDTLANLFGAIAIFIDKPFRIGDVIKLTDVQGSVESIGLRSTRVRNFDGHLITIPNKTMGNATITNVSRQPNLKTQFNVGLSYNTSLEQLKQALQILEETFKNDPATEDLIINFNQFTSSSLNIQVQHWAKSMPGKEHVALLQKLNLNIKKRFDDEQIEFAFPSQTIYLKSDSAQDDAAAQPKAAK